MIVGVQAIVVRNVGRAIAVCGVSLGQCQEYIQMCVCVWEGVHMHWV